MHTLLILKRKSKNPKVVASGRWTPTGGKRKRRKRVNGILVERESSKSCARRENREEVGFEVSEKNLVLLGRIIGYESEASMIRRWNVAVYAIHHGTNPPKVILKERSKIEKYQWFPINRIPWDQMIPSDKKWLPSAVQMVRFGTAVVYLDKNK